MRNRKRGLIGLLLVGLGVASGGCIDAVPEGFAAGVADGIATVIEGFITDAAAGATGDEE